MVLMLCTRSVGATAEAGNWRCAPLPVVLTPDICLLTMGMTAFNLCTEEFYEFTHFRIASHDSQARVRSERQHVMARELCPLLPSPLSLCRTPSIAWRPFLSPRVRMLEMLRSLLPHRSLLLRRPLFRHLACGTRPVAMATLPEIASQRR